LAVPLIKQKQVWPLGLADAVCPRPPLMTQGTALFPELRRGRDETYRSCEFVTLTSDLETGEQCSTCRGVPSCQFWWYYYYSASILFMCYWVWARISGQGKKSSLSQQQPLL